MRMKWIRSCKTRTLHSFLLFHSVPNMDMLESLVSSREMERDRSAVMQL